MRSSDRIIWLRRPPRVQPSSIPFVPRASIDSIALAWDALTDAHPHFTDGACWHVIGVHRDGHGGATVHVTRTNYRMGAVRSVGVETGFIGLGTKGIAHWQGRWLIGRRSESCATYPGQWEFAPGGAVEPGEDPSVGIERELMEECGVRCARPPRAAALIFDGETRNWEVVHQLEMENPPDAPPNWEYSEFQLIHRLEVPPVATPCTAAMIAIARGLFAASGSAKASGSTKDDIIN